MTTRLAAGVLDPTLDQGRLDDFVNGTQPLRGLSPRVHHVADHDLLDLRTARLPQLGAYLRVKFPRIADLMAARATLSQIS